MEIKCPNCGAVLQYQPGTTELACSFCGQKFKIENKEEAALSVSPDSVVSFKVTEDEAIVAARIAMRAREDVPDDLADEAKIVEVKMFYFPIYLFFGEYSAYWTASFGFDRRETYQEYNKKSNQLENRVRTVTDWRPASGTVGGKFGVIARAMRLSDPAKFGIPAEAVQDVIKLAQEGSVVRNRVDFDPKFLAGMQVLPFEDSEESAWRDIGRGTVDDIAGAKVVQNKQGDRAQGWNWDSKINWNSTEKVLIPIILVRYSYHDQEYCICLNGENIEKIQCSSFPIDEGKASLEKRADRLKYWAKAPFFAVILATLAAIFFFDAPVMWVMVIIGLVLSFLYLKIFGWFINSELKKIKGNSEAIRQAGLMQRLSQDGQIELDAMSEDMAQSAEAPQKYRHHITDRAWVSNLLASLAVAGIVLAPAIVGGHKNRSQEQPMLEVQAEASAPATDPQEGAQQSQEPQEAVASGNGAPESASLQEERRPSLAEDVPGCALCLTNHEASLLEQFDNLVLYSDIQSGDGPSNVLMQLADLPKLPGGQVQNADAALAQVEQLFNAERYGDAVPVLAKLVRADRSDAVMRTNAAYALFKAQRFHEAASQSALAVVSDPRYKQAWRVLRASCKASPDLKDYGRVCARNANTVLNVLGN